jgi:uncharacterized repeat protein (TIGR01451 family)
MSISTKLFLFVPFLLLLLVPSNAFAETPAPQWTVTSVSRPTVFAVGGKEDAYVVLVTNTGGASSKGTVTITDELPIGLEGIPGATTGEDELLAVNGSGGAAGARFGSDCREDGEAGKVSCTYSGVVVPDDTLALIFPVSVAKEASASVTNVVRVSGGGASSASLETSTAIAASEAQAKEQTPFGVAAGGASTALSSVQAGAHPDLTTSYAFNTESALGETAGNVKDIVDDLPAGFAGDLVNTEACEPDLFLREECPIPTQVGVTTQVLDLNRNRQVFLKPVYNIAPEPGEVAKIGFNIGQYRYVGDISVRSPGELGPKGEPTEPYGLKTTFYSITASTIDLDGGSLTIWGVPASPIHNALRWSSTGGASSYFGVSSPAPEVTYFTNPTACTSQPLEAQFHVTSWQHPEASENPEATGMAFGPIVGCDAPGLQMGPSLTAEATSDSASAATGFDLDTGMPQTYPDPAELATSTLNREVVTLPEGMTVNPSSGAGLQACSEAQYGEEQAPEKTAQEKEQGYGCPNSSKLATVRIKSPSIEEEVTGSAYLAEPAPFGEAGKNPFKSLLALYLIARAPKRGVLVKAPGLVEPNPETGRLTTTFGATPAFAGNPASPGLPPLPASLITFAFNQGANAPLVTPPACGSYEVKAALTQWTNPLGSPLTPEIPPFQITNGVDGGPCPAGGTPPFAPGVTAGTENNDAGAYSPLDIRITRNDGEQEITGFASQLPVGLTGNLSGIPFCGEAEIQRAREQTGVEAERSPACPAGSEIGYSLATAGVGSVLAQTPGKIYLGGPYDNAPFSVVAVTSAHVGPFDLGTVVIHFPLDINPETADVTIPASPSDVIPHIIKGIVVHIREIRAFIDRHDFMINPTSCEPFNFSATVIGAGADPTNPAGYDPVTVSTPFRVTACQALKFAPKFAVSTSAKTSRIDGASLHVDLSYPAGALGNDANIKEVKVDLPEQLPSRLPTLQKACTEAQFQTNPAGCPPASRIGSATAVTPILPVPLAGPAFFVSNGSAKWPELVIVLQGDGVTIDLHGETLISKQGVTSSTFHAVPDQPVSSFELTLPEGPYSALTALGNLCAPTSTVKVKKRVTVKVHGRRKTITRKVEETQPTSLAMPTEFVGQNGATVNQNTPITVSGCPKAVHRERKAKAHRKRK